MLARFAVFTLFVQSRVLADGLMLVTPKKAPDSSVGCFLEGSHREAQRCVSSGCWMVLTLSINCHILFIFSRLRLPCPTCVQCDSEWPSFVVPQSSRLLPFLLCGAKIVIGDRLQSPLG